MKVQRVQVPETQRIAWLILDDAYLPVEPIRAFLRFREQSSRSPNTIQAEAHHLKLFWEYLRDEQLEWTQIDVAHLAGFIRWLRLPTPGVVPVEPHEARRTDATIDQMLSAVHSFYDFHMRMKSVPDLPLYHFLRVPSQRYKPFLYGIVKSKPVRSRFVKVKREQRHIQTLTHEQVQQLLDACSHLRDRFLVTLLYDTGIRIGQALGLRHEDVQVEEQELWIVPREENANGARAKTRDSYAVPISAAALELYIQYLIEELGALESEGLPDYVFVNLWEGERGRPMTYDAARSLFRRLEKKTKVEVTAHLLRHTRATEWIRDDHLPLSTVSRLLGHASVAPPMCI